MKSPYLFSLLFVVFLGIQLPALSQDSKMVDRITAIKNNGFSHFGTDGINIAGNFTKHPCTEDGLKDAYKAFDLSRKERKKMGKGSLLPLESIKYLTPDDLYKRMSFYVIPEVTEEERKVLYGLTQYNKD